MRATPCPLGHATGVGTEETYGLVMAEESETQRFFRNLRAIENQRVAIDKAQLLDALRLALAKSGHVRLINASPDTSGSLSELFVLLVFWGLGAAAGSGFGWSWPWWIVLSIGIAFVYLALAAARPAVSGPLAALVTLTWLGTGITLALTEPARLVWAYAVPIAVAIGTALVLRTLRLREARDIALALAGVGRSAPYVAPVVLIAILLPALTADVWQLAAATDPANLIGAALLSIGVLLLFVGAQLRRELEPAFAARSRSLAGRPAVSELTRTALVPELDEPLRQVVTEIPDTTLAEAWPRSAEEYAPYLVAAEGGALRRPLMARLLITTGAVGLLFTAYIYALLAVTVPSQLAVAWSTSKVLVHEYQFLGLEVRLQGRPYIPMAILLGVFATAIFLAFALTEERIAAAITEALLREPIDRFLVLALPFVALTEAQLQVSSDDGESSDPAGPGPSDSGDVSK